MSPPRLLFVPFLPGEGIASFGPQQRKNSDSTPGYPHGTYCFFALVIVFPSSQITTCWDSSLSSAFLHLFLRIHPPSFPSIHLAYNPHRAPSKYSFLGLQQLEEFLASVWAVGARLSPLHSLTSFSNGFQGGRTPGQGVGVPLPYFQC